MRVCVCVDFSAFPFVFYLCDFRYISLYVSERVNGGVCVCFLSLSLSLSPLNVSLFVRLFPSVRLRA